MSNLALLKAHELVAWGLTNDIKFFYISNVSNPRVLDANHLPSELKAHLLPKYQKLKKQNLDQAVLGHYLDSCIHICQNTKQDFDFAKTVGYLRQHDQTRGNSYLDVFPELAGY
jgi:hypothetical protein